VNLGMNLLILKITNILKISNECGRHQMFFGEVEKTSILVFN
jgi:hypothetical protein